MKALIFDMDGLMIDTEKFYFEVERNIASAYGKSVTDDFLKKLMGRSPLNAADMFIKELNLDISPDEFLYKRESKMELKYKNELEAMPGLMNILNDFKDKMKLAIATGSPKKFLDIAVDKLNIREYFEILQPSDEIKNGKPDPEIYLKTIKKLNLDPGECIILEDSSNGAKAGKKAGCYTIAVKNTYTEDQEFGFTDFVCDNLYEANTHITELTKKRSGIIQADVI